MSDQITIHDITSSIPADEICVECSVKERSIRLARENGFFPASWYVGIRRLCAKHGLECPENLFNWKSPSVAPSSEAAQPEVSCLPEKRRNAANGVQVGQT